MNSADHLISLFGLNGAVAVITGAGHGIGKATAQALARAGAHVVLADLDETAAGEAALELRDAGASASSHGLDVASENSIDSAFVSTARQHGRVDILVNNAGVAIRHPSVELTLEDWNKVVSINLTGAFLCARAAGRLMLADGRGGPIVNTASIMGLSGGGLYPNISYQSTKGAVVNMTRALAVEWARSGIRVNAVAPTWVRTRFIGALTSHPELMSEIERVTPLGRLAEPEEVAAAILFLASPAASMITGHILPVDGGYLAQ